jgi:hypothetical protein
MKKMDRFICLLLSMVSAWTVLMATACVVLFELNIVSEGLGNVMLFTCFAVLILTATFWAVLWED